MNGAATLHLHRDDRRDRHRDADDRRPRRDHGRRLQSRDLDRTACQVVIANDDALQGAIVTGTVTSPPALCVRIYDIGKVTAPVNYTITVVRPSADR